MKTFGRAMVRLVETASTNRDAIALALAGQPHGLTVVADAQTAGRGRLDHIWESPAGVNLYFSVILRPHVSTGLYPQIPVLTAMALHQALATLAPETELSLKWPNDLWTTAEHKKLSGILCEGVTMKDHSLAVIAGIGINVNGKADDFPEMLHKTATSLRLATGREWDREIVLKTFLERYEQMFDEWEKACSLCPFMAYWDKFDVLAGKQICIGQGGQTEEGEASGIDEEGRLKLRQKNGMKLIHAGDAHIRALQAM